MDNLAPFLENPHGYKDIAKSIIINLDYQDLLSLRKSNKLWKSFIDQYFDELLGKITYPFQHELPLNKGKLIELLISLDAKDQKSFLKLQFVKKGSNLIVQTDNEQPDIKAVVIYFNKGLKIKEEWFKNHQYHRLDGPTRTSWHTNGKIYLQEWFKHGKRHRLNNPAYIKWYDNGSRLEESWYYLGQLHRLDGPAFSRWHLNGQLINISWFQNDKSYSVDGPSTLSFFNNGVLHEEIWRFNGKIHRENKPAYTIWYDTGNKYDERWYNDGKLHRVDGPAITTWSKDGNKKEHWYINGTLIN